jgi:hypothetical protein
VRKDDDTPDDGDTESYVDEDVEDEDDGNKSIKF